MADQIKRPQLQLKPTPLLDNEGENASIEVAVYDALLPCRKFRIAHKVAVLGKVSLTSEFLLRLVRIVEGIQEDEAASFFGFNRREMSFALEETEGKGYIERRDGKLWLTVEGGSLFRNGNSDPEIFTVESRSLDYGFDLLSLAPESPRSLDYFQLRLPELPVTDEKRVGTATLGIPHAFRRFYSELADRRDRNRTEKKDLYSVDGATPLDRFSSPVRIVLRAQASTPALGEGDLSLWRPDYELDDRPEVVSSVALFIDSLRIPRRSSDGAAYEALADIAPEFLKDFIRKDGLAVDRYYKEALTRAGDLRADRKTIPIVGSILLPENRKKLIEAIDYGLRDLEKVPPLFAWVAPQVPHWGATTDLADMVRAIKNRLGRKGDEEDEQVRSVFLTAPSPARYFEKAFDRVCESSVTRFPPSLEVLLIPNVVVVAVAHTPIGAPMGHPVPLGLLSFDKQAVERTNALISENMAPYVTDPGLYSDMRSILATNL